jgi:hypothetical protein
MGSAPFNPTSGYSSDEILGDLTFAEPVLIRDLNGFRSVATGFYRSAGISADGTPFQWDAGEEGSREIVYPTDESD